MSRSVCRFGVGVAILAIPFAAPFVWALFEYGLLETLECLAAVVAIVGGTLGCFYLGGKLTTSA